MKGLIKMKNSMVIFKMVSIKKCREYFIELATEGILKT